MTINMSNFLTPIKILLDMDVKTKSTYRAALEGLDISMDQILTSLSYDPYCQDKNPVQLYRNPTDFRLEAARKRLTAFATNKEVGIIDYVKYAHNVVYDFLQVIKLGHLHNMQMNSSGMFEITISNTLHESGIDHNTSTKTKFESQLDYLARLGLETVKEKCLNSYHFSDTDTNRAIIKKILSDRGAMMIRVDSWRDNIDQVSFTLNPANLRNFIESPVDYTLPVTEELNDDEMIKLKKLVNEIPSSLAFIKESPDMIQTCGFLAESCFAEIEEICGFDGNVFKRVKERHAKERAANMNIHDIEKEIGSQFPAEIARDVMNKLAATMAYFCVENLHATCSDLKITEWGTVSMGIRINQRSEDLRYCYYFDKDKYNEPTVPVFELMDDVFDVVNNRNGGIRLIDNENNRDTIASFAKSVCGLEIDSISVVRDDCYITRTRCGSEETCLKSIFVIDQITVSTDNIDGILRQHDLCKMRKGAK
jgi:hypothetical protein